MPGQLRDVAWPPAILTNMASSSRTTLRCSLAAGPFDEQLRRRSVAAGHPGDGLAWAWTGLPGPGPGSRGQALTSQPNPARELGQILVCF